MFHNSTTIWHNHNFHDSFVKEKRMPHKAVETAKAAGKKVLGFGGKLWKGIKIGTWPARMVLKPVTVPLAAGFRYIPTLAQKLKRPVLSVRERLWGLIGLGKKPSVLKGLLALPLAPFIMLRNLLLYNTRDGIKAALAAPGDTIDIPSNVIQETKQTAVNIPTRLVEGWNGAKEAFQAADENLTEAWSPNPFKFINGTRKAIQNAVFAAPYRFVKGVVTAAGNTVKLPVAAPVIGAVRPFVEKGPVKITKNTAEGLWAGPSSFYKLITNTRGGLSRFVNGVPDEQAAQPVPA